MKTISEYLIPYRAFLQSEKQRLTAEAVELEAQSRQDEANLIKIRLNIYGVFETVAAADEQQCDSWPAFCDRYLPRFDTLTAPWSARLASAVRNSDTHTRFIEETKLSTAQRIRKAFLAVVEDAR